MTSIEMKIMIQDLNKIRTDNYVNCNAKELQKICEYYGIKKSTKGDMILKIITFEGNINNSNIVTKRKIMWSFIDELSNDGKMKKYILWN